MIPSLTELRKMTITELERVATQLRAFVQEATSVKKGHIESSLTVTELTVALHAVFNTPEDVLIWDVGHQAYVHKVLTDRASEFHTNRQLGGISGFPNRSESEFDAFGTGHSSTSISAITGFATMHQLQNVDAKHIAVIGDGALTGGMAFEALNYLGTTGLDVLIILNDNRKAIDPNVGALHDQDHYQMFFESLNIRYLGEVDGHSIHDLSEALRTAKALSSPRVLHVRTRSEVIPTETTYSASQPFQDVFGEAVEELLAQHPELTVISPAMLAGAGLKHAQNTYPDRVFDVGIAEQHAATMAAGIAAAGGTPLLHLYSTFAQRAFDQIIHDIALQNLKVVLCIDRAGLVGNDGATHHGAFDLSALRAIPNLTITSPRNGIELRNALYTGIRGDGPFVIRYPRDEEVRFDAKGHFEALDIGSSEFLATGDSLCIMSTGTMSRRALEVASILKEKGYNIGVLHHLFVKPLDHKALKKAAESYTHWLSLEDGSVGGLGSALSEWLHEANHSEIEFSSCRLPDEFIEHGSVDELHSSLQMDTSSLVKRCMAILESPSN